MKHIKLIKNILVSLLILGLFVAAVAITNPDNIAYPAYEHLHFRMSYSYRGVEENFSESKYQEPYSKDTCTDTITKTPVHFHDDKNHTVHVHWRGLTGGQVLKYYGVNKIDWLSNYMGIKARNEKKQVSLSLIPVHTDSLPKPSSSDKIFIFTGNSDKFELRKEEDFYNQELETFFNKRSSVRETLEKEEKQTSLIPKMIPNFLNLKTFSLKAYAHSENKDKEEINTKSEQAQDSPAPKSQDELKKISNTIGDVVIFVQPERPQDSDVEKKFKNLAPLSDSTCGG